MEAANKAKEGCPISRLLNADITMDANAQKLAFELFRVSGFALFRVLETKLANQPETRNAQPETKSQEDLVISRISPGVRYMLVAAMGFAVMHAIIKSLSSFHVLQVIFFRSGCTALLCTFFLKQQGCR